MPPFLTSRGSRRLRLGALLAAASVAVGSCLGDASGPEGFTGYFALAPSFESGLADLVPLAEARVTLERSGQTAPAIDTIVPIQPGDSTVDLSFTVVLLSANETFLLNIKLISPAGDTVFQAGPIPVTAGTDPSTVVPIDVPFVYTGTGAGAAGVRILSPDTTVTAGDEVVLVAEAFDDAESPLPGTPIGWASADPSKAQVVDETVGRVLAGTDRGTARITATLLTGQADTALITIQLPPTALVAESGSGQTGPSGNLLPDPLVARVTASDGVGVLNELVQFTVVSGGGTLSATSARTDDAGRASVQWTLGQTVGAQLVEATTARLPGVTAAFAATAEAPGLTIVDGDGQSALVGTAVAIVPTVRLTDPQSNPLPDVDITFAVTGGGGTATGATVPTDANGLAAVGSWVLGPTVGLNSLTASAEPFEPVTFTATATGPGGATSMTLEAGDGQTAVAGTAVTEAPAVLVTDESGNAVVDVTVNFAVTAGGGTIEVSDPVTDGNGIASVATWTLGSAGANELTASLLGLPDVVFTATGTLGAADAVVIVSGNDQSADAGTQLPAPLVVEVQDAGGNPVPGETVTWDTQTGSLSPTTGTTNALGQTQTVWTLDPGIVTHTATATVAGLTPAVFTATALFPNPTILLALASGSDRIVVGGMETLDITLTAPAAAGGVDVDIFSDNPAVVAVEPPAFVTIPEGQTTGQGLLTGVAGGASTVRASAQNYAEGTLLVTVSVQVLSLPATLNVPFGGTASVPVQISTPAPAGGVDVTLVSSNPAAVDVLTPTVTIPEGSQTANGTVSGVAPGTATVTGTTVDYGTAQSIVSTTANLNIVQTSATINAAFGTDLQIQLESGGSSIAAPAGGVTATLSSADPACAVATSPVTIPAGQVEVTSTLTYGGSATLPCNTTVTASAPNVTPDNLSVRVDPAPGITLFNTWVTGSGLMRFQSGRLAASNHGGVTVRLTSADPEVLLLSPNTSTEGTAFIDIPINDGFVDFSYYTHGLEGATGTVTITASVPGFTDGTNTVDIVQPALDIISLNPTTTTLSADDPFQVRVGVPAGTPPNQFMNIEEAVRAGAPALTVTVTNDSAAVAQLVDSVGAGQSVTVQIQPGSARSPGAVSSGGVAFDPLAAGATTVTAAASGYIALPNASIAMTVTAPGITVFSTTRTGSGLMRFQWGRLDASNHGGVTVRLTSADPQVLLLSPDVATAGTPFVDIPVSDGFTDFNFYTHGLEGATGTVTITATAPGFTDGTATADIVQPALDIITLNPNTTTLSADDPFQVRVGVPGGTPPNQFMNIEEAVRAGAPPLTVTVTNDSARVAQLVTTPDTGQSVTVQIQPGSARSPSAVSIGGVAFDPLAAGASTVTATASGYVTLPAASVAMTVTAPSITVFNTTATGSGLMRFQSGRLEASNHGGVTVRLTSSDSQVLLLSPDASTAGTPFIDIPINDGFVNFTYYTHGLEGATGTVPITASAPGFTDGTNTADIVQPALEIIGLNPNTTTLSSDDPFQVRIGVPAGTPPSQFMNIEEAIRAGAPPLAVTVDNSNGGVAQLVDSVSAGQSVTVQIQPGNSRSPGAVPTGGVAFDPLTAGATTVTAAASGYIALPNASIAMTVTAPVIEVFNTTATGSGLMRFQSGRLGAPNHGGVTVRLTSSDPQVLLLSPNGSTEGTQFIDIPISDGSISFSYYTHGLEGATGTVVVSAEATGFVDGSNSAEVVQPAFELIFLSTNTTAGAADDPFQVRVGIPNASQTFLNVEEAVRAGAQPLMVTVDNSDAAVAQLTTTATTGQSVTVEIQPGATRSPSSVASGGIAFDPLAAGSTTVSGTIAAFIALTNSSLVVTVSP